MCNFHIGHHNNFVWEPLNKDRDGKESDWFLSKRQVTINAWLWKLPSLEVNVWWIFTCHTSIFSSLSQNIYLNMYTTKYLLIMILSTYYGCPGISQKALHFQSTFTEHTESFHVFLSSISQNAFSIRVWVHS